MVVLVCCDSRHYLTSCCVEVGVEEQKGRVVCHVQVLRAYDCMLMVEGLVF